MDKDRDILCKTALQVVAVLCLISIFSMIFHKAVADLLALAEQYSGREFWVALAWKAIWNLAAGG